MIKRVKLHRILMVIIGVVLASQVVSAAIVSFDLNVIFSGPGVPFGSAPWVTAVFDDDGSAGSVDLTITAVGLNNGDVEKLSIVYFNLDPALDPTGLVFSSPTKIGSFLDPIISTGTDAYQADGDGMFDIMVDFDNDGPLKALNGGESVKYTITLASLTANSFDFVSVPGGGMGEFKAAAHLLSLGTAGDSAFVATPEPATLLLLGLGGLVLRRKRR